MKSFFSTRLRPSSRIYNIYKNLGLATIGHGDIINNRSILWSSRWFFNWDFFCWSSRYFFIRSKTLNWSKRQWHLQLILLHRHQRWLAVCLITREEVMSLRDAHPKTKYKHHYQIFENIANKCILWLTRQKWTDTRASTFNSSSCRCGWYYSSKYLQLFFFRLPVLLVKKSKWPPDSNSSPVVSYETYNSSQWNRAILNLIVLLGSRVSIGSCNFSIGSKISRTHRALVAADCSRSVGLLCGCLVAV